MNSYRQNVKNVKILLDTERICYEGRYAYAGRNIELPRTQSTYHTAQSLEEYAAKIKAFNESKDIQSYIKKDTRLIFDKADTFTCVENTKFEATPLVLNFASSVSPGGGVRNGASAQEEDLCRRSNLLQALDTFEHHVLYYDKNRLDIPEMKFGTSDCILTKNVTVFKNREYKLELPKTCDVITMAAPNLKTDPWDRGGTDEHEYLDAFAARIKYIFAVAAIFGYNDLVLGAWGCGAYRNDPVTVAGMFNKAINLPEYRDRFRQIIFAIPTDNEKSRANYEIFAEKIKLGKQG